MAEIARGKRASAKRLLWGWAGLTAAVFLVIVFAELEAFELDALIALHATVTMFASAAAVSLFGLDAWPNQILPAMRRDHDEEWTPNP